MSNLFTGAWRSIKEPTGYSGAAVYAVRLVELGRVIPIPRFFAPDPEGILTIGMASNLEYRRCRFISGYKCGHGHSASNLLFRLSEFPRHFPSASFEITFCTMRDSSLARDMETKLTRDYWQRYGEAPPLTSVVAGRYIDAQTPNTALEPTPTAP
jgi:hypothetical protein